MFEIFSFYSPGRWSRPNFQGNVAALHMWMMLVYAAVALLAFVVAAVAGKLTLTISLVLGGSAALFILLAKASLPEARRRHEIDRIARRHDQERRRNIEPWMYDRRPK